MNMKKIQRSIYNTCDAQGKNQRWWVVPGPWIFYVDTHSLLENANITRTELERVVECCPFDDVTLRLEQDKNDYLTVEINPDSDLYVVDENEVTYTVYWSMVQTFKDALARLESLTS